MTDSEDRDGVPPDDTSAETPLGVGESINTSGEDQADEDDGGRDRETDQEGNPPATRPAAENTGVNPQEPPDRE